MNLKNEVRSDSQVDVALANKFLDILTSSWMAQALYVAAELRIADLLADGPKTSEELAQATKADGPALRRLLRALSTIEICRENDDDSFEMTELGLMLRSDVPESLRSWTIWWGTNLWQTFGSLLYSVTTGLSARQHLTGKAGFAHLEEDAKMAETFNQALAELTRLSARSVVGAYDFSRMSKIVDVGGGLGELLVAILKNNAGAHGVLFDLAHAKEGACERFEHEGLSARFEFVVGDFFVSVPSYADAYVLKSILHDWKDDKCEIILKNCHRAMNSEARLVLIERVLPEELRNCSEHHAVMRVDLQMLVNHGAGERSAEDFRRLLDAAGFRLNQIVEVAGGMSIIEAAKL